MLCNLSFSLKGCVIPAADTFWRGIFSTKLLSVFSIKLSNIFSLLSGKCQPGWTLLDDTCWMYHGGPMTYKQGLAFCAKDNATLPTLRNYYQYHLLAAYLNREQVSKALHNLLQLLLRNPYVKFMFEMIVRIENRLKLNLCHYALTSNYS